MSKQKIYYKKIPKDFTGSYYKTVVFKCPGLYYLGDADYHEFCMGLTCSHHSQNNNTGCNHPELKTEEVYAVTSVRGERGMIG
jgi:hypothetical protein